MSKALIRIGTRSSPLALWQARWVQKLLKDQNKDSELVLIQSQGDQNSTRPLYEMNIQGVFTKALDIALLDHKIDIAVHSYKDVPTLLATGISNFAVLKRGNVSDILVTKTAEENWPEKAKIGTSSLRRSAQWKHRYPSHDSELLRGNVQKRLETLGKSNWIGALFASAGLERVEALPLNYMTLDWMIPAPAQGAVCIAGRTEDKDLQATIKLMECANTQTATQQERLFLRLLEGGCSAPIGALMTPTQAGWHFKGGVFSLDGKEKAVYENHFPIEEAEKIGALAAEAVLADGGAAIMSAIKKK